MNRAHVPEKPIEENVSPEAKPVGGVSLNGSAHDPAPFSKGADGHALIHVNGVTVDPRLSLIHI